jgi:hypothetical protein
VGNHVFDPAQQVIGIIVVDAFIHKHKTVPAQTTGKDFHVIGADQTAGYTVTKTNNRVGHTNKPSEGKYDRCTEML